MSSRPKCLTLYKSVTKKQWPDFERLFGEKGGCAGCWCMYWRLGHSVFESQKGEANKKAMKAVVDSGKVAGIIAYDGKVPVGWCSIGKRESFPRLANSRILKPVDDKAVWSIVCLFVERSYRRHGWSVKLLKAAIDYAAKNRAAIVEGYPTEVREGKAADAFVWTGLASAFKEAGFKEVARRSEMRPIMRYFL